MKKKGMVWEQTTKKVCAAALSCTLAAGMFYGVVSNSAKAADAASGQQATQTTQVNASGNATVKTIENVIEVKIQNLYCDEDLTVLPGKSAGFETHYTPENAYNPQIGYTSEDPTIATVDATGMVTGVKPGITYVNVTALNSDTKASARVKIIVGVPKVTKLKKKSVTAGSVTLQWKKIKNVKYYQVYKYNAKKKKYVLAKTVKKNKLTVKKLSSKTKYKFKVRGYRKGAPAGTKYGIFSKVITVTTK